MVRLAYLSSIVLLAPVACVTPSQSLGAGDSTGDDATASATQASAEDTTGDPVCAPTPGFTCTVPYDGSFGECGDVDFDEDCCLRPTCDGDEECGDGESCLALGNNGLACSDVDVDGVTVCSCSADPGGPPRRVCLPSTPDVEDWCAVHVDEAACTGAPPMDIGPTGQYCAWIDVTLLTPDLDNVFCEVGETVPRCVTIENPTESTCLDPTVCALQPSLVMSLPWARYVDGAIEVFGVEDQICGEGLPVGTWQDATDEIFAPCAFTCGVGPCDLPFVESVEQRAAGSKDAPVDNCGSVTLADSLEQWQGVHDCALDHATAGLGFRLVAEGESIDSLVELGFVGLQAESYAVVRMTSDDNGPDPTLRSERPGTGLVATADCTVAVGELCLELVNPGENLQTCPVE